MMIFSFGYKVSGHLITSTHSAKPVYRFRSLLSTLSKNATLPRPVMQPEDQNTLSMCIRKLYGFNKVTWIKQLGGLSSLNYGIQADGRSLILKKYRSTDRQKIEQMEKISQLLHRHNLPVCPPLPFHKQQLHFTSNKAFFALFPKTEGIVLHEPELSQSALIASARLLTQLHQIDPKSLHLPSAIEDFPSEKQIEDRAGEMLQMTEKTPLGPYVDPLIKKLIQTKLRLLKQLYQSDLFVSYLGAQHLVHGDFHNENILFDQTHSNILRLLDFEQTHLGHRVEDLLHFIFLACCNTGYASTNIKKARTFMNAYTSILPLTRDEITFGINYELFKECSSMFLEHALYETRDLFIVQLIERDLKKFLYFEKHMLSFIQKLLQ